MKIGCSHSIARTIYKNLHQMVAGLSRKMQGEVTLKKVDEKKIESIAVKQDSHGILLFISSLR